MCNIRPNIPYLCELIYTFQCGLEDLTLEADESFESPMKGKQRNQEDDRRKSLRSYTNQKSQELETPECIIDSNFMTLISESPLPKLPWADPNDVWERMIKRESDYEKDPSYFNRHPNLQVRMRSILLDWLIEVSSSFFCFGIITFKPL